MTKHPKSQRFHRGLRRILRLEGLESRDVPSIAVFGADQGGGPLVAVFDTQAVGNAPTQQFYAYDPSFRGGVRVAAADITADGVPDIITAAGPGGGPHVKVFDGKTGTVIRSFYAFDPHFGGGVYVAAGDVNGDGVADVITAAGANGGPHIKAFDGKTGSMIREFFAFDPKFTVGVRVSSGDVNNDGFDDIIAAAGLGGGPHVRVFSGKTGKIINEFFAFPAEFSGGVNVAAGDLNGDGSAEIITGPGPGGGPLVRVWSGTTPQLQSQYYAYSPIITDTPLGTRWQNGLYVGVANLNADGDDDIVVGPGPNRSAAVRFFDGQSKALIQERSIFAPGFAGGIFVGGNAAGNAPAGPPQATLAGNPVNEGSSGTVSFTNPFGGSGGYTFSFDFDNDGTFEVSASSLATTIVPASYLSDGPGSRVVHGRISDSDGHFTDYTTTLVIANVPPTVVLGAGYSGKTSTAIAFSAIITDPSPADTAAGFTYSWNFGDGSTSTQKSPSHAYAKAGSYTVSLTATDKDGGATTATADVTVTAAAPPQATLTGDSVNEGATGQVAFTNATGGTGGYTYSFDFDNNGIFEITNSSAAAATVPASYLVDGPGSRSVLGRITDSAGTFSNYTTTISIANVPPAVQLASTFLGTANASINFSATVTDPSSVDTAAGFTYGWNFGDGSTSTQKAPSHAFATAGSYTVSLTATDKDGGATSVTATVTITAAAPPQATLTGSTANEGATGQVGFSNPSGGSGGYQYSFDFDNDGTFEITKSATATATVPASFLADGPGSRTVLGRITDSSGAFADYTSNINILNVPPAVQLSVPSIGVATAPITFAAVVTDPSSVDTAAGFTYEWNFGDGSTSTQKAPSRAYATPGTYTVTLTVRDKDNGATTQSTTVNVNSANSQYIQTSHDKIPNFGANPTVTALASGNWSNPATWSTGKLPAAGDVVSIEPGIIVSYDQVSDVTVKTVSINAGGSLRFRTDISTRLTVVNLLVMQGGELQIGTATNPVAATAKAEVIFADVALDLANDPEQFSNGLIALGTVTMHGAAMSDTFVRLAAEPLAGATTLTLAEPVTGWKAGDRLVLPDTRHLIQGEWWGNYVAQWETRTIGHLSPDGLTVTLTQPLQFDHVGARNPDGVLEFLPHVGNLTRTVSLRSQSNFGTRGHTYFTNRAEVDIRYSAFQGLGRTLNVADDNTTLDANNLVTHVGTNQAGRYPVNFRHLLGPAGGTTSGSQFIFSGNAVTCMMNPQPFRWGITVHDSHYGLIEDNVVYNWAGAGVVAETGSESYNVFAHNFVVGIKGDANPRDGTGREGVAFWTLGFNNSFHDNVATSAVGTNQGIVAGAGYSMAWYPASTWNTRIPLFAGADTTVAGQYDLVNMQLTPIREFARNEVYGATSTGLTLWQLGSNGGGGSDIGQSVISDFRAWHVWEEGFFGYPMHNVLFEGFTVRGHARGITNGSGGGWTNGDYWAGNVTIRNADIQGMNWGIGNSSNTPGAFRIENSFLRNYNANVIVNTLATPGSRTEKPPRTTYIDNVHFAPYPGAPSFQTITMSYSDAAGGTDFIQRDEVLVHDFNGVVGDNFQVYYLQQSPTFIVPQTSYYGPDYNNDGIPDWIDSQGSPVAGLTNEQNWALYGIAIAGCVSPTSATRSGVTGFVRAF